MKQQQTAATRFFALLLFSNLLLLALLLLPSVIGGITWNHNPFVHRSFFVYSDRFADFYNPAQYAMDRDLVPDHATNSPPFLHFCGYLVSKFIYLFWPEGLLNHLGSGVKFGATIPGYSIWLSVAAANLAVLGVACGKLFQLRPLRAQVVTLLCVGLSHPFLYAIDRGNYVLFAAMLLVLCVADYEKHPYRAAVWLGLAAALKMYPALLGILFLRDKRWKPAALCAGTGIGVTLGSFLFFSTGASGFLPTVQDWFTKMRQYSITGNVYSPDWANINELLENTSMRTPAFLVSQFLNPQQSSTAMLESTQWVAGFALVLLAGMCLACLLLKKNHDVFLLCTLMMVAYPLYSGIYNVVLTVVPLLWWIWNEPENQVVAGAGFLLLLNKVCVVYCDIAEKTYTTLHGVLSPLLVLFLVFYILWLRRQTFWQALCKAKEDLTHRIEKTHQ